MVVRHSFDAIAVGFSMVRHMDVAVGYDLWTAAEEPKSILVDRNVGDDVTGLVSKFCQLRSKNRSLFFWRSRCFVVFVPIHHRAMANSRVLPGLLVLGSPCFDVFSTSRSLLKNGQIRQYRSCQYRQLKFLYFPRHLVFAIHT